MEHFAARSCEEFVAVLGSKAPVPGGGGASALVGALGIALGNMVGCLTVGKKKYADVEEEMQQLMARCQALQEDFLRLIDADAKAFEPLSRAYSMPRETPEEREAKAKVLETALLEASRVPLEIMRTCAEALDLIAEFAAKGSALAVSDAGTAALFCKAAMQGASLNVYINTKLMADREMAGDLETQADVLLKEYTRKAEEIHAAVLEKIRG